MEELNDIDSILASVETSTNQEIPMTAPDQVAEQAPIETQTPKEWEFESEGRKYKANEEKLLRWAQQGVTAPNKIGELSRQNAEYQNKLKEYQAYDQTYKPIDEWAKKNPDKWQSLVSTWHQAQTGQPGAEQTQSQNTVAQLPPEVINKLQEFDQRFQKLDEIETVQRTQAADQGLDGEISSIRTKFPNLDLDAPHEPGSTKTREYAVLEHATKFGIPSFEAAFWHLYGPHLNSMSETKGREKAAISPKTRAGLLGKDQAPVRGQSMPDLKTRNYDQIHQLILERELGFTAG